MARPATLFIGVLVLRFIGLYNARSDLLGVARSQITPHRFLAAVFTAAGTALFFREIRKLRSFSFRKPLGAPF